MIKLTSTLNKPIVINPDYITKFYEHLSNNDEKQVVIVMADGSESVKETIDEILNLIKLFKLGLDNYPSSYPPSYPYGPPFIPENPNYGFPGINPSAPIEPFPFKLPFQITCEKKNA